MIATASVSMAQTPVPSTQQPAQPQSAITDNVTNDGRWDCSLPGGNYTLALSKIVSTSIHTYLVPTPTTTAAPAPLPTRVQEVNVTTEGSVRVRFYYVESATDASAFNVTKTALERVTQVANEAANRAGALKPWQMVQKDYPQTTHLGTVEFRVASQEELNRLYGSLKRSWITGKGAQFSVK
jgi:hypothetical protein